MCTLAPVAILPVVDDNVDFTLLTPEVFELREMEAIMLEGEEAVFMEQIWQSTQYDDPMVKALKALDMV